MQVLHALKLQYVIFKSKPFKMGRGDAEDSSEEYRQILQSLRGTAEGLLINQVSNVWNIYGGLNRLHHVMEKIFKHGCRVFDQEGDPDCWVFIQGLSWLQPSLSASPSLLSDEEYSQNLPPSVNGKALVWLYKSLECHTLSQKLFWLLSDREHLLSCFEKTAYLCQEQYGKATITCLRAVEQNQPSLLAEIDPCLYLASWNFKVFRKTHRKCSSFPEAEFNSRYFGRRRYPLQKQKSADAQLSEIMSRVPLKKSPLGAGCFGSDIRDADKEEEGEEEDYDRESLCEEATEGTFAGDVDSATTNEESNNNETSNENEENGRGANSFALMHTVKYWYSLPSLVSDENSSFSLVPRSPSLVSSKTTALHAKHKVRSCPSLPCDVQADCSSWIGSVTLIPSPLETSTSASVQSPCSKLSPSLLEIDYNILPELHSENGLTLSQRCGRNWRNGNAKLAGTSHSSKRQLLSDEGSNKFKPHSSLRNTVMLNTVITSSGSSDTLNLENNRLLKSSSQPSSSKDSSVKLLTRSNTRPCDLKLSPREWERNNPQSVRAMSRGKSFGGKSRQSHLGVVGSAPEYAHEWPGSVDSGRRRVHKKSFIEDGGSSVLPMATGFFPQPLQGQSLTSFLSSEHARPSAELDRENAHFNYCEIVIAAIEVIMCDQQLAQLALGRPCSTRLHKSESCADSGGRRTSSGPADETDEEGHVLKQRIRLRRPTRRQHQSQQIQQQQQKLLQEQQRRRQMRAWSGALLSDGRTDTTTTDQSISPLSSSPGTPSESLSTDGVDDLEVDEVQTMAQLKHSGLSVSMASLYSEADLSKPTPASVSVSVSDTGFSSESIVSAEGVALSLLRQFSEKQLPRASDLQWLVSEQDAPQQLLPLPTSWPISPDEAEDADMRQATPLRGTTDWAPPRPQIIFTPHPNPVRRVLMAKQNYRCAGCGMKVAVEYAHRFRYCEYLGRYFCTGCHTNQLALIPGKVLTKWDFTRCPVSNFSYRLLDQMMSDPLFRISDLNPSLYRKVKQLERTRQLRLQLYYMKDFIFTCRFADELQQKLKETLKKAPNYLLTDVEVFSMSDLQQVRTGVMTNHFRDLFLSCKHHVDECPLCQARGFVCEVCSSSEVIFPWQLQRVAQCRGCGACFHNNCWNGAPCPRCQRRSLRRLSTVDTSPTHDSGISEQVPSSVTA